MIARAIFAALVCLSCERPMIRFSWYLTAGFYVIFVYNNFLYFSFSDILLKTVAIVF